MFITKQEMKKLNKLIELYKKAAIEDSWSGSKEPNERVEIKESYVKATRELDNYIASITE